ncbi:hypothetical protein [Limosilactobacillus equigenerosi]|uniref:hypothetical protein n=2 Tax=Limosilactobacillus equigenerosi TaxID=417373 RepID=UPI0006D0BB6F|nr:hypothetical protein [Limosilactobacillus equigenerosi]
MGLLDELNLQATKGDPGKDATITIGTVTTGDTASVTNSGTQTDAVFNFVIPKGEKGENGKSAYELAVETGMTAAGTPDEWLNSLYGRSAYEVAKATGFSGTVDAWLASLKGDKGDPGDKGDTALTLKIGKVTTGDQPSVTNSGTATDLVLDFVLPDTQTIQWDNYTTTTDLEKKLNGKQDKQDMANYYDAKSVDKLLANKADLSTVANVPDKVDVQNLKTENQQLRDQVTTLSGQLLKVQSDVAAINAKLATLPAK